MVMVWGSAVISETPGNCRVTIHVNSIIFIFTVGNALFWMIEYWVNMIFSAVVAVVDCK